MPPPRSEAAPIPPAPLPARVAVPQAPALQRNLAEVFAPYRMEHAAFFVRQMTLAAWDDGRRAEFLIEDAARRDRLGRIGLDLCPHEPGAAEIGYWVARPARGGAVATAAVRALCPWAFAELGLDLIEWRCETGNVASRRVAEKSGFVIEGTLRARPIHRGTRGD